MLHVKKGERAKDVFDCDILLLQVKDKYDKFYERISDLFTKPLFWQQT